MRRYKNSKIWFFLLCFLFFNLWTNVSLLAKKNEEVTIKIAENATNIGGIKNDTLIVISGSTVSFSVDTPEDQGLISTVLPVEKIATQIQSTDGSTQKYKLTDAGGLIKLTGEIETGDRLIVSSEDEKSTKNYTIQLQKMALSGKLELLQNEVTAETNRDITLRFTAGQRSPDASVSLFIPKEIKVSKEQIFVNIIGRGTVPLNEFEKQSIGRVGTNYSYSKVGTVEIIKTADQQTCLVFSHLDLRPANGPDILLTIKNADLPKKGNYQFSSQYSTAQPEVLKSAGIGSETTMLVIKNTISDLSRIQKINFPYRDEDQNYSILKLKWTPINGNVQIKQSLDNGKTWQESLAEIDNKNGTASVSELLPNQLYSFSLLAENGEHKGVSNSVKYYSGKLDIKQFGVIADGTTDNTQKINEAIEYLNNIGGGTLLFSEGVYCVRTVQLKSNICIYIEKGATIKALKGSDAPESTWFSDKKYRSGLSPTATGPYDDPENYLTKQDVGHTYFQNTMFFGERLDYVKIIGNGRITGDGNLATSDKVMNGTPDKRADKMFTFRLCTNIEIGGINKEEDLWYDETADEPYYIEGNSKNFNCDNMLDIDRGGHFVLLATGTDNIYIHNTYLGKYSTSNARDIYDFMGCNNVDVTNIYCKESSDDIVKLGSDCSLGYTRPAKNYKIRNIIGDTNCNLFQIGSETADDITDVYVDNIYVLGANKAGFSISTNDGGHVKNIHLNSGQTGVIHSRSKMFRTTVPFFISISNRGRIIGADVKRFRFDENGTTRDELLCTNINIGEVENITLNAIDISEVYRGSSYRGERWKPYDGMQDRATPIVAGYKLPDPELVEGGLNFTLPNQQHTAYITNISFTDVQILVKGGNSIEDSNSQPKELGVGQYNVKNLGTQPSYGLWVRHAKNLKIKNCSFNYEKRDSRFALVLNDVVGAEIESVKMIKAQDKKYVMRLFNSSNVTITNSLFYKDKWEQSPTILPSVNHLKGSVEIPILFEERK